MTPNLYWIPGPWRGRLAISARPRGGDWLEDEVRGWRAAGIDIAVSLLEPEEESQLALSGEGRIAGAQGIRYLSLPIPDRGIPTSMSPAISLLAELGEALDQGKNVAVHCRQGIGRSALIAVSLLLATGLDPASAIRTVSVSRGLPVPETGEQLAWLHALHLRADEGVGQRRN